jgi:hypothetical protein
MSIAEMKRDHADGRSLTIIGLRNGMSAAKVREILRGAGVEVSDKRIRQCTKKRDARIREMLLGGYMYRAICESVGCSNNAVTVMRRKMKADGEI